MTTAYPLATIIRFSQKILFGDACWEWTAGCFDSGYGAFSVTHTELVRAHRFSFEVFVRPLLEGECALHSCDNRKCCRPKHLFAGSQIENVADRDRKGRQAFGERSATAVLTAEQVMRILADDRSQRTLGREYGVCKSTIGYIKRGEYWKHVQPN